jgi:hypothetical protein
MTSPSVHTGRPVRITLAFNKPTMDRFFDGGEKRFVTIRLTQKGIQLRPESRLATNDTLIITNRGEGKRGGAKTTIEGQLVHELAGRLTNPHGNPFFILVKEPKSAWIDVQPFDGDRREPPKFVPHLRVGEAETAEQALTSTDVLVQQILQSDLPRFVRELRDAQKILAAQTEVRPGRRPKEVVGASVRMRLFRSIVQDILPVEGERVLEMINRSYARVIENFDKLQEARSSLETLVDNLKKTEHERSASILKIADDVSDLLKEVRQSQMEIRQFLGDELEPETSETSETSETGSSDTKQATKPSSSTPPTRDDPPSKAAKQRNLPQMALQPTEILDPRAEIRDHPPAGHAGQSSRRQSWMSRQETGRGKPGRFPARVRS